MPKLSNLAKMANFLVSFRFVDLTILKLKEILNSGTLGTSRTMEETCRLYLPVNRVNAIC